MLLNFKKFLHILGSSRKKSFFFTIFFIFLTIIFETFSFGAIFPIIIIILDPNELQRFINIENFSFTYNQFVSLLICLLVLIFLIKNLFSIIIYYFQCKFTYNCMAFISNKLFSKYIDQEYEIFLKNNTSTFIKNTISEVQLLIDYFLKSGLIFFSEIILLLCFTMLSLYIAPFASIVIGLIFISFFLIFNLMTKKYITNLGWERQLHDKNRIQILQETFGSIKTVKLYSIKDFFLEKYAKSTKVTSNSASKQDFFLALPRFFLEFILVFSVSFFILVFIYYNQDTKSIIPQIGMLLIITFRLLPSINRLQNSVQNLRYSSSFISNIYSELKNITDQDTKFNDKYSNSVIIKKNINFNSLSIKNVNFAYDEKTKIFESINLHIKKNTSNAILGVSGSGKTSLIDLIMGFHSPSQGRIIYNDEDLNLNKLKWQSIISYVPQNIFLVDDTLANNIAFGTEEKNIDINKIKNSINLAQLSELVFNHPKGINMHIGENGNNLSGGQKQRLGIARALYYGASILIMDEPTSSLDSKTMKNIYSLINQLKSELTIIVITHDNSNLDFFDNIFEVADKKINQIK